MGRSVGDLEETNRSSGLCKVKKKRDNYGTGWVGRLTRKKKIGKWLQYFSVLYVSDRFTRTIV